MLGSFNGAWRASAGASSGAEGGAEGRPSVRTGEPVFAGVQVALELRLEDNLPLRVGFTKPS
jgi:hypothetical protein